MVRLGVLILFFFFFFFEDGGCQDKLFKLHLESLERGLIAMPPPRRVNVSSVVRQSQSADSSTSHLN